MKVGFIGAGKVGFTLGKYLKEQHVDVIGYYSRNILSAKKAAEYTATNVYEKACDLLKDSDVLFIAVPDDAITTCYHELCNYPMQGKILCHTSGALTANIAFPGIEKNGAYGYSVHPMFAISDKYHAFEELSDVFFTLEGSEEKKEYILNWLTSLGLHIHIIDAKVKGKYHAAAAIVSNQVVALFAKGQEMLMDCGFSQEEAKLALTPLFLGNATNVAKHGPVEALTGPVQRGDIGTLEKHLSVIDSKEDKLQYVLLSRKLIKLAKAKNPEYESVAIENFLQKHYTELLHEIEKDLTKKGGSK